MNKKTNKKLLNKLNFIQNKPKRSEKRMIVKYFEEIN
jgi:hypothetical protein